MYAALLENATFDKADFAYAVLENYYIDWNEIRVCTVRELADTLTDLPNPEAAAERVRKALQGIFEKTYTFDLEEMRKKGKALAEHIKTLESMSAGTPYMIQYVAQVALDGHLIPFDEASLRIMRRLGLSQVSSDGTREVCIGLDRVILKKSSLTFAAQLHHFAASYYDVPDSPELLSQLSAIDREAVNRSWISPVLAASSFSAQSATASVSASASASASATPVGEVKAEPTSKPQTPKEPPKSVPVTKPAAKPAKQPVKSPPVTSSAKSPAKKPMKSVGVAKTTPQKVSQTPPSKKGLPNDPVKPPVKKPLVKPPLPKKKVAAKAEATVKNPAKSVKKPKVVTPSKALRKKKPK